jgi:SOS response regulatory protein OraA/RecX
MPKIGTDQHLLLHQHYPNECCLCEREKRVQELEKALEQRECKVQRLHWKKALSAQDAEVEITRLVALLREAPKPPLLDKQWTWYAKVQKFLEDD